MRQVTSLENELLETRRKLAVERAEVARLTEQRERLIEHTRELNLYVQELRDAMHLAGITLRLRTPLCYDKPTARGSVRINWIASSRSCSTRRARH